MLQKAVLRPDSALVVCCGLLAKWLRVWVRIWVRVRVRVRAGARECTSCTWFISVVNTLICVHWLGIIIIIKFHFTHHNRCKKIYMYGIVLSIIKLLVTINKYTSNKFHQ